MKVKDIQADELLDRLQKGEQLNLLDVREPVEFSAHNIGGTNIPLSKLETALNKLGYHQNEEIIVICKMGLRSETGQHILQQHGFKNVRNLEGGLLALYKIR
ncbi:rhodanese-like domain-containing protein [Mucilaginibacter arboris]|uniref:Rhodanese-like domain-containing protein n=1 Tax=Mucilaginibacter arboris TaxID=2682090 RepID=A0A7K1T0K1_9SPHI|nr:rhodanese-like domain-containing protein [Mucilaginibacter arboris]MVN23096.1 rhodanese-like domain-containing protein [Mucilaginibacter arboris]